MSPEIPLAQLAEVRGATAIGELGSAVVNGVAFDSRRVASGDLFCCVPGDHVDGHDFAQASVAAGAAALLVDHELTVAVPQLRVDDVRAAMAVASSAMFSNTTRSTFTTLPPEVNTAGSERGL